MIMATRASAIATRIMIEQVNQSQPMPYMDVYRLVHETANKVFNEIDDDYRDEIGDLKNKVLDGDLALSDLRRELSAAEEALAKLKKSIKGKRDGKAT